MTQTAKDDGRPYRCERCGGTFMSDRDEVEATEEFRRLFGDVPKEAICFVCDDCWREMNRKFGWTDET